MSLATRTKHYSPLVALACCLSAAPILADDSDIFLVDAVPPNIVILLDSSGSMSRVVPGGVKLDIAKEVVANLIEGVPSVSFGVFRFNDDSTGGEIVGPIGSDRTKLIAAVNDITPIGMTPLGRALADVQDYYLGIFNQAGSSEGQNFASGAGRDGSGSDCDDEGTDDEGTDDETVDDCGNYVTPVTQPCQESYVIVITDGMPNGEDTNLVADVASSMYGRDHSATLDGLQNIITYTVGFDVPEGAALLTTTASNGGGAFYTASNATELSAALQDAVMQIMDQAYSFAAPMFPSTSSEDSTQAYIASFEPSAFSPSWRGYLKAYAREDDGSIPVDSDNIPLESAVTWEAGTLLAAKAASTRTIYTAVSGARQAFTTSNGAITRTLLGVASDTIKNKVINFIRGTDAYDADGDGNTTEQLAWKLGDIFHSAPVLVFPPPLESSDESYQTFKETNANRTSIVLVGANDGMLHAFRASDGQELWGFIPTDLLDDLRFLTVPVGSHRNYVDGTPVVTDVKISGTWKTVVIFGTRRGGLTYYALDITDTTNPLYLWSYTSARMGETWSVPAIGKVKISGGTEKTVAFVGGGYDTAANNATGKAFFAIDVANGTKLWEYYNSGSNDTTKMNFSLAASPTAVDLDRDGFVDHVYVGDVGGQLWKFDVSAEATLVSGVVTNWTGRRLFAADSSQTNPPASGAYHPAQAIYGAPALAYDSLDRLWVFFGTGNRNEPNATSSNRFYGLIDDGAMTQSATLTESSLTDMSSGSGTVDEDGWYMELRDDEKVLDGAEVFAQIVYFSTYQPVTTDECDQQHGTARVYAVGMEGTSPDLWEDPDQDDDRSHIVGSGIPSAPEVTAGGTGALLVVGTTSEELSMDPLAIESEFQLRYWREVY